MNTTAIKNFAQRARREFRRVVTDKAHALGIAEGDVAQAQSSGDALIIHGQAFPLAIKKQRDDLVALVRQRGFGQVIEAMAYTLFNRFCALRFMEVHDYLPQRAFSSKDGGDAPDILRNALDVAGTLFPDAKQRQEIRELKLAGDQDQKLYTRLILAQCNILASAMPFLFERQQDFTELLMPENLLHSDSIVRDLVTAIDEADWREIEIIGWLYQFYISERKDEVIGKVVAKEDIPAATQLFTPKWIVRYMVENSLGRLWLESHPESPLKAEMPYFTENPDNAKEPPARRIDTPDEITCMDDACGSGHVLVYKFDLLHQMYAECGYPKPEIPSLILRNNLYGLDIDERAVQLASFALMMKAREKDPGFLGRGVFPNVIAIQESNGLDLDAVFNVGVRDSTDRSPLDDPNRLFADTGLLPAQTGPGGGASAEAARLKQVFRPLVQFFHDAKNYGSLLVVPESLTARLPVLKAELAKLAKSAQLFDQQAMRVLSDLVRQAEVLAMKFDVCVTNPPYMGNLNQELKAFAKEEYPDSKADLFAMFIERSMDFVRPSGYTGMVTMQSWMFLSSFERLREKLLSQKTIVTMAHIGPRGFDSISGEIVQTTAFVVKRSDMGDDSYSGSFFRLVDGASEGEKSTQLLERQNAYRVPISELKRIPGNPIAYWASRNVRDTYARGVPLETMAKPRLAMTTSDNDRFMRMWWEVGWSRIGLRLSGRAEASRSRKRWFPCCKGGAYRKWYGNNLFVINWEDDGRELLGYAGSLYGSPTRTVRNMEFFFRENVTWSSLASSSFGVRYSPPGFLFATGGSAAFPDHGNVMLTLALLCSPLAVTFARIQSPTLNIESGTIASIPFRSDVLQHPRKRIEAIASALVQKATEDWDSFETSWDFKDLPLLRPGLKGQTLAESWQAYARQCAASIARMQELETENNRLFIDAYGLQDELKPEVPEDQITLARADAEKDMKAFVSYAIGCMMGRYSPDRPGLQFAGGEWDETKFTGSAFTPDPDGILPVLGDAYFEDDPTERLARFLSVTYGKDTLNDNLQFIAHTLGMKSNETPRDTIRRYLAEGFFKDHLRTYKRRPIYWFVTSGKERAFQALIYMHRYTPATLSRLRTAYLHELQNKLTTHAADLAKAVEESTSVGQRNRLSKELAQLRKQQAELLSFDERLNNLASQKIAIDLDDGVKHNYGLFGDLLAEVKAVTGGSEE